MIDKDSKVRYFLQCFLMLICLAFSLSACINISGEIICEECESGKITIKVFDCKADPIVEETIDGCGNYSVSISPSYSGEKLMIVAHCDEDSDGEYSIGDGFGEGEWFELQQSNEVNIDINREITATVEGEVTCDAYTSGLVAVRAFEEDFTATLSSLVNYFPLNANKKASYKVSLLDVPLGSKLRLHGHWDKDENGICHDRVPTECDYVGRPEPFILDNQEITGMDINACESRIYPCQEEVPQEEYTIDNLPGCDDCPSELNEMLLAELVEAIKQGEYGNVHSLVIIHNDSLALEEYFKGWNRHMLHQCYSATKSYASALTGIAIDQGYISGVDEKLLSFFPEYDDIDNLDERKKSITLEDVLTMTAGFTWDEASTPYVDSEGNLNLENDASKLSLSDDWMKYMLDQPMNNDPGELYVYNSGCSMLLSGIMANETGQTAEEFAEDNFFSKMGITEWEWQFGPNEITNTGWGLILHPVNMAMFGYLYLKNGLLNGEQIVPENWVKESTSPKIEKRHPVSGEVLGHYGYQWHVYGGGVVFIAHGGGAQFTYVIPAFDLIIVMTADNWHDILWADPITNKILEAITMKG